jgi:glycine dehydrogenase subunit 2
VRDGDKIAERHRKIRVGAKKICQKMTKEPLIFERGAAGRRAVRLPKSDDSRPISQFLPENLLRKRPAALPEVSELDVVRHFTRLSQLNFSIDTHFYPLGSCTMKYNPKVNEKIAALSGFANVHPLQPAKTVQGLLQLLAELEKILCEICGMDAFSLQPAAGAQGELTGVLIVRAHHLVGGNPRKKIVVPDNSHGTNPASASLGGYRVVTVPSGKDGEVDLDALARVMDDEVAAIMLTNPSTHGLFESRIQEIAKLAHAKGALLYYDGANLNALCGLVRPGDMGFDIVHLNTHKTFSTPHGGGGPGAGPVGVKKHLEKYLPVPRLRQRDAGEYFWDDNFPHSIGKVRSFHGNIGVLVRAHAYLRAHGADGLLRNTRAAIVNANYLKEKLKDVYTAPFDRPCLHECVLSAAKQKAQGSGARDIAKRILDFGFHAPTIYFPLTVSECLMIEPTETESHRTLDRFVAAMREIAREIAENPQKVAAAPHTMPVKRLDEVRAARELDAASLA